MHITSHHLRCPHLLPYVWARSFCAPRGALAFGRGSLSGLVPLGHSHPHRPTFFFRLLQLLRPVLSVVATCWPHHSSDPRCEMWSRTRALVTGQLPAPGPPSWRSGRLTDRIMRQDVGGLKVAGICNSVYCPRFFWYWVGQLELVSGL